MNIHIGQPPLNQRPVPVNGNLGHWVGPALSLQPQQPLQPQPQSGPAIPQQPRQSQPQPNQTHPQQPQHPQPQPGLSPEQPPQPQSPSSQVRPRDYQPQPSGIYPRQLQQYRGQPLASRPSRQGPVGHLRRRNVQPSLLEDQTHFSQQRKVSRLSTLPSPANSRTEARHLDHESLSDPLLYARSG